MKTPLVFQNLLHQWKRTSIAVIGVAFAVLLIFMQLGFYNSAELSATTLFDALDFDLLVRSRDYLCLTRARPFPLECLERTRGHPQIADTAPVYVDWQLWRNRQGLKYDGDNKERNYRRIILVLAFNLQDRIFNPKPPHGQTPEKESVQKLAVPNTVLVDTYTRKYFGQHGTGAHTELNGNAVSVVGEFTIGTGLGADGLVVTSAQTYALLAGAGTLDRPTLGLIRLKKGAGPDADAVKDKLNNSLFAGSAEVEVLTRAEVEDKERKYWLNRTPVGVIFKMGVAVACLVAIIFVYQVIATDIADHSAEYATLRAIGYSPWYLSALVLRQAAAFAIVGYVLGLLAANILYLIGRHSAQLLLFPSWGRAALVLVSALAICFFSGLLAIHKVKTADPADQF